MLGIVIKCKKFITSLRLLCMISLEKSHLIG